MDRRDFRIRNVRKEKETIMGLDCYHSGTIKLEIDEKELANGGSVERANWYDIIRGLPTRKFAKPDVFDNIENVFFNSKKGTTVIKWKDGSISKSTCDTDDHFDPFIGFCIAYTTKGMSKSKLKERIQRKFKKNNNG